MSALDQIPDCDKKSPLQAVSKPFGKGFSEDAIGQASMIRVWIAVAILFSLSLSCFVLSRRWSGAFSESLSNSIFAGFLLCVAVFSITLVEIAKSCGPSLSERSTHVFAVVLCLNVALWSCAIYPLTWSLSAACFGASALAAVATYCLSETPSHYLKLQWSAFVCPIASEFFIWNQAEHSGGGMCSKPTDDATNAHGIIVSASSSGGAEPPLGTLNSYLRSSEKTSGVDVKEELAQRPENDLSSGDRSNQEPVLKIANYPVLATIALPEKDDQEEASGKVLSTMIRRQEEAGEDILEVQATAIFPPAARLTVLHVPFVPPFATVPKVECEVSDGSDVRLKVGTVFTYGVRIELKRTEVDLSEQEVKIDLFATQAVSRFAT